MSLEDVLNRGLSSNSDFVRTSCAIFLGLNLNENYNKYSAFLLQELSKEIHFENVRLGIKSAWTIALVLAENLKPEDYHKLKNEFRKWSKEEQEDFLYWLKEFTEQIEILT